MATQEEIIQDQRMATAILDRQTLETIRGEIKYSSLIFNKDKHEYSIDYGNFTQRLPSVTQILSPTKNFMDNQLAILRGKYAHQACDLIDEGTLDMGALDPSLLPYVVAYEAFLADSWAKVISTYSEKPLCDKLASYAGTPDRVMIINGDTCLIDIKTGSISKHYALQTAAYAHLLRINGCPIDKRYILNLKPNGKYKLILHDNETDFRDFLGELIKFLKLEDNRWQQK